jgi:4-amino-4-deoxy-L-arabinose transferase-like glycosyltransferase
MFTVEFALLILLCGIWLQIRGRPKFPKFSALTWHPPIIALILAGGLGLAITGLLIEVDRMPHGDWDGWAIWNNHARLLYRGGSDWASGLPYVFHGDYPLLTSAVAARFWRYAGEEVPEAGAILGILAALSAVAILVLTLRELRDAWLAGLFGLVLLGTPLYLDYSTSQYADIPLSLFILTTIVLIFLHWEREPNDPRLLVLAGFTAGCAGWTKNDGLLFILAASSALLMAALWKKFRFWRRFASFLVGLLIPLLVITVFKLTVAPPNDLIENQDHKTMQRVLELDRHITILKNVGGTSWTFGGWSLQPMIPLFAFVVLRGADRRMLRRPGWLTGLVILSVTAIGYYFVYLITPLPLQYHLDSSLARLMLQLWPSFLLLLGLIARSLPDLSG